MKVEKVVGDFYDENTFVVTSDENCCLIIDPGAKLEAILPLIDGKFVQGILITHGHFDHVLHLQEVAQHFSAPIYGSDKLIATIQDTNLNVAGDGWAIKDDLGIHALVGDGKVKIGDFEVEYFATPGHSPCGECYKIGDYLFAGDTVFNSGIGRLDLEGSSKESMIASLEKLSGLEFATMFSGHGEESDFARQKRNIAVFSRFLKR